MAGRGEAWHGLAWRGTARPGAAWQGLARESERSALCGVQFPTRFIPERGTRHGAAWPGRARRGAAGRGGAWLGTAGLGMARDCEWHTPWFESKAQSSPKGGVARHGKAGRGGARRGEARQGWARLGKVRICLPDQKRWRSLQDRQGRQSGAAFAHTANRVSGCINPAHVYLVQGTNGYGVNAPPKVQSSAYSWRMVRPF